MKKILYLAVVSAGLILSSCSMSRETASLSSQKLQARQEFVNPNQKQDLASVNAPTQAPVTSPARHTVAETTPIAKEPKKVTMPSMGKHFKTLAHSKFVNQTKTAVSNVLSVPKMANQAANLVRQHTSTAHANWMDHKADTNFLLLWILCVVAAIVFYVIGAVVATSSAVAGSAAGVGAGVIFFVLGFLFSVAALIFFIIWLVQLIKNM